jgi:UDP-glucose:(heptosyl)LPS alpha-1,3-glucosyltransferase
VQRTFTSAASAAALEQLLLAAKRRTVALVAHGIHDQGGMERALYELVRRGHDRYRFVVLSAELDERLRPLVEWRRIRVPRRPSSLKIPVFSLLAGFRLWRTRASLVHTMGAVVPNRADVATVQFCSAGFVERTGVLAPRDRPPLRRLNSGLVRVIALASERWCYRRSRVRTLAAVSRGVAGELTRHYPGVPITVTPNGVDVERFKPDPDARAQLRREENVGDDEVVLLFVGNDWEHKGLRILIEAAAQSGVERLRIWVVGRGNDERYSELARAHGVPIRFFGIRRDTERWYSAADVFVLPTLYETFSLVAYEAATAGLPVVATRVNGIDELLEGERAGLFVSRDAESVATALRRLAVDASLRARLGAEGRARAADFDWRRSTDAVLRLYRELGAAR